MSKLGKFGALAGLAGSVSNIAGSRIDEMREMRMEKVRQKYRQETNTMNNDQRMANQKSLLEAEFAGRAKQADTKYERDMNLAGEKGKYDLAAAKAKADGETGSYKEDSEGRLYNDKTGEYKSGGAGSWEQVQSTLAERNSPLANDPAAKAAFEQGGPDGLKQYAMSQSKPEDAGPQLEEVSVNANKYYQAPDGSMVRDKSLGEIASGITEGASNMFESAKKAIGSREQKFGGF